MLEKLLELLARGPFETRILAHAANAGMTFKATIVAADSVGIICLSKGLMDAGKPKMFPWSAIIHIEMPA